MRPGSWRPQGNFGLPCDRIFTGAALVTAMAVVAVAIMQQTLAMS